MICMIVSSEFSSLLYAARRRAVPERRKLNIRRLQFRGERKQSDILRALNGYRKPSLMARAGAGHAARKNLAALLDERRQNLGLLVVNEIDAVDAKTDNLLLANEPALAAFGRPAGPAAATLRARTGRSSAGTGRRRCLLRYMSF